MEEDLQDIYTGHDWQTPTGADWDEDFEKRVEDKYKLKTILEEVGSCTWTERWESWSSVFHSCREVRIWMIQKRS